MCRMHEHQAFLTLWVTLWFMHLQFQTRTVMLADDRHLLKKISYLCACVCLFFVSGCARSTGSFQLWFQLLNHLNRSVEAEIWHHKEACPHAPDRFMLNVVAVSQRFRLILRVPLWSISTSVYFFHIYGVFVFVSTALCDKGSAPGS